MKNQRHSNFRILWGGHFLSVLSSMVIAPMLPFYMEQLGAEDEASVLMWSGLSLAAPAISAALTAPLWGRLGDLTSRKWMVVRSVGLLLCVSGDGTCSYAVSTVCPALSSRSAWGRR